MKVLSLRTLREFWEQPRYADAEQPLRSWYDEAKTAAWETPQAVKLMYRTASFVAGNRVVFNIAGNKYRLIVAMDYPRQWCKVRFIGTHAEYDKINATEV
ncbi:type II toxin-antitoxin system HigB family toxin [Aeromonas allosaccharophila]|uniref:type II toxin-antitoxin system HigB family toxin n=1 Tax=Aeromonas allosaccharophila TaxID=656 RepID=UPI00341556E7